MQHAPLFDDIAEGPTGGKAYWVQTDDRVRLRIGHWQPEHATGTVLLFPGRTEYIEKYGRTAVDLAARGLATVVIDWRGQGLADRLLPDDSIGHVGQFHDYQSDVQAMVRYAEAMDMPRPWYLMAHSMGGCIGLRALHEGLDVKAAIFSSPMWGIQLSTFMRPVAWTVSWAAAKVALGHLLAPGTKRAPYTEIAPFLGNSLTSDCESFAYMQRQTRAHAELALGGPSLHWLNQALRETLSLASMDAPNVPCLTFIGDLESIIDDSEVRRRMAGWPLGQLIEVKNAQHEVLMETPTIRANILDEIGSFIDQVAAVSV